MRLFRVHHPSKDAWLDPTLTDWIPDAQLTDTKIGTVGALFVTAQVAQAVAKSFGGEVVSTLNLKLDVGVAEALFTSGFNFNDWTARQTEEGKRPVEQALTQIEEAIRTLRRFAL